MEGFTIVDGVVALVIVLSAILAYSRGFVRELMSIAGWVAAAILAFLFAEAVQPLVLEIPYVGEFLQGSCEMSMIAAFAAVFALALIVSSIFTPLFSSAIQNSAIGTIDQGLGFLFGVARGVLLVAVAFVVYDRVFVGDAVAAVDNSRTAAIFARAQSDIDEQMPEDAPGWIVTRYEELVSSCTAS
jgi:membrane protein required for colicin V production